ncbi:hypothetical protein [Actinokineospora sp. HUAS TT18]|uniref:hypothetical protein n=1 Tax=Actinokineospora sp. HUAS TT18 TaxID=3447451 RepID=UPI003F526D0A
MCYSDSPNYPTMRHICTDRAHDARLDCGHNDYCHTNPPPGSFLANNYNMADNTFLIGGATPPGRTGPVRSALANKCLDANGNGSADGTKVQTRGPRWCW